MNGEWLGSRAIRVNWANQKTQTGGRGGPGGFGGGSTSAGMSGGVSMGPTAVGTSAPMGFVGFNAGMPPPMAGGFAPANDYETIAAQTPAFNTTVYVGNLIPYSTQQDLIPLFQASPHSLAGWALLTPHYRATATLWKFGCKQTGVLPLSSSTHTNMQRRPFVTCKTIKYTGDQSSVHGAKTGKVLARLHQAHLRWVSYRRWAECSSLAEWAWV